MGKSFEELLIADWLAVHGIRYEYEKPYEHRTEADSGVNTNLIFICLTITFT